MSKSTKATRGSVRAKANLPAKAGKRRPPHIKSVRDKHGKRDWVAACPSQRPVKAGRHHGPEFGERR